VIEPPSAWRIDDAEQPRHAADRGRQQDDDDERDDRSPDHLKVVAQNLDDAVVVQPTTGVAQSDDHARHDNARRSERCALAP
jgi:hypothetical protein